MKYADIKFNDIVNGEGICVSFWTQGCPHRCFNCHNPQTWDYDGGIEDTETNIINKVINGITLNGIQRNFSILGGEPLCKQNLNFINHMIDVVKSKYPNIKIYLWTGYEKNELTDEQLKVLNKTDYYIVGRYINELRDITLKWRGSSNQEIIGVDKNGG